VLSAPYLNIRGNTILNRAQQLNFLHLQAQRKHGYTSRIQNINAICTSNAFTFEFRVASMSVGIYLSGAGDMWALIPGRLRSGRPARWHTDTSPHQYRRSALSSCVLICPAGHLPGCHRAPESAGGKSRGGKTARPPLCHCSSRVDPPQAIQLGCRAAEFFSLVLAPTRETLVAFQVAEAIF